MLYSLHTLLCALSSLLFTSTSLLLLLFSNTLRSCLRPYTVHATVALSALSTLGLVARLPILSYDV